MADLEQKRTALHSLLEKLETRLEGCDKQTVEQNKRQQRYSPSFTDEHVKLFASLFRGRDEVFAKRWESRSGRSGFTPVCKHEWVRGICKKPRIKCSECFHREFVPLTPDIIRQHFMGKVTVGAYPLLKDETCHFLAVDFDKSSWMDDVTAFVETCNLKGVEHAVERSRSGKGAHVWFFFKGPLSARLARRFGCALLTQTMERRHRIGLDSYDRLFPNQDTMPKGGFGSLIALPLQYIPAQSGNSLFVDSNFNPYIDQWSFLNTVRKLPEALIKSIEEEASRLGRIIGVRLSVDEDTGDEPWDIPPSGRKGTTIKGPLPSRIEVVSSNLLYIEKASLPSALINQIIRIAAFQNPSFYQAQALRLSTFGKPRIVSCADEFDKHVAIPRGCFDELAALFGDLGIEMDIMDKRFPGTPIDVSFKGSLLPDQEDSVRSILPYDIGVLSAPTAFGKTVVGANLIAKRGVNALVLVHRKQLLDQWRARLSLFLDIEPECIGQIGSGKQKRTGFIDVAMLQTLNRKGSVDDSIAEYGHVLVDECHHVSAFSFEQVLRQAKGRYVVGVTATPSRKDGHHPIIFMQCGPIRFSMSPKKMAKKRGFEHRVVVKHTNIVIPVSESDLSIHILYRALIQDQKRNGLIVSDIEDALREGRSPIVLTERREHLQLLADILLPTTKNLIILYGGLSEKERRNAIAELAALGEGEERLLLATGRYIGEGFDDSRLDTLFLTMPVSWRGTLNQYAGRLHRSHHAKKDVIIYDYVDSMIPMAKRMFEKRKRGYTSIGYDLEEKGLLDI